MLIDTHCHFNHERLRGDVPDCIERANAVGVTRMIVVGYDLESSEEAVRLAVSYAPSVYAVVGVHPHDARLWDGASADRILALTAHPRVVAVGEIGLDFYRDLSPRDVQIVAFRAQMAIARNAGLPVVIHCRDAYEETLHVLADEGVTDLGGVMHCWAGTVGQALRTTALGMTLGFGGTLTFKNADEIRDAAREAPLDSLLVETDAPYLAPIPHRGRRNEPAYVRLVADALARLRDLPTGEIADRTTANALRIFPRLATGIPPP